LLTFIFSQWIGLVAKGYCWETVADGDGSQLVPSELVPKATQGLRLGLGIGQWLELGIGLGLEPGLG